MKFKIGQEIKVDGFTDKGKITGKSRIIPGGTVIMITLYGKRFPLGFFSWEAPVENIGVVYYI